MPIPEPGRYRPSNLTKEQRHEQLAAVYGVNVKQELSHAEIERMRQIVQGHDAQRQPLKTIDLNNPPHEPYHFQKFPKMVYGRGSHLIVHSEDHLADALADGYSEDAPMSSDVADDDVLSPKYQAEVERVQEQLEQTRRKPGPKPKVA